MSYLPSLQKNTILSTKFYWQKKICRKNWICDEFY